MNKASRSITLVLIGAGLTFYGCHSEENRAPIDPNRPHSSGQYGTSHHHSFWGWGWGGGGRRSYGQSGSSFHSSGSSSRGGFGSTGHSAGA